jgi:hypothetical protein
MYMAGIKLLAINIPVFVSDIWDALFYTTLYYSTSTCRELSYVGLMTNYEVVNFTGGGCLRTI